MTNRTIVCQMCRRTVAATGNRQIICNRPSCQRKHRSLYRKRRYQEERKDPICQWCEEPILEPRARKYHHECYSDKEKLRVMLYDRTNKIREGRPRGSSRHYSGNVTCQICNATSPRTGARQIVCATSSCASALKLRNKRSRREQQRELEKIRAEKQLRAESKSVPASLFAADVYRGLPDLS